MDAKCKSMDDEAIKGVADFCRSEFDADYEYDVRRLIFSTTDKTLTKSMFVKAYDTALIIVKKYRTGGKFFDPDVCTSPS